MKTSVERVPSADGTSIALEVTGHGSAVVLIGGAFNDRTTTAGLAQVLAPYYRAVTYDRRGRGESVDESVDYSADREMEDLRAVIDHLGGTASLVGHSSGAVLALEAAMRRLPVDKVAAYEPPFRPRGFPATAGPGCGRASASLRRGGRSGRCHGAVPERGDRPAARDGRGHAPERDVGLPHPPRPLAALRRRAVRARLSCAGQPTGSHRGADPGHRRVQHLPVAECRCRAGSSCRPGSPFPFARRTGSQCPASACGLADLPSGVPRLRR